MARDKSPCRWEVQKGEECGEPADGGTVLLRERLGSARVPVCKNHKAEYNRRAASLRVSHG
jgi:hypothetical protein